jgi:1-deoxy-D-xylulose-5-phosphate synthase
MYTAQLPDKGTFVIRYPRGRGVLTDWECPLTVVEVGTGRRIHDGWDVAVLSIGPIGNDVEQAIQQIESAESPSTKDHCPSVAHYDMRFLKPLDEKILEEVATRFSRIVTIEDGVRNGGLGSAVTEWMNDHGYLIPITRMGLPDNFVEHGTVQELKQICGIDVGSIKKVLTSEKG